MLPQRVIFGKNIVLDIIITIWLEIVCKINMALDQKKKLKKFVIALNTT